MRLDEDDLYDHEDDSFDEDGAILEVVAALKPERVTSAEAEAELEKTHWDIDEAVANLKTRLRAKSKSQNKAKVPMKGKLTPLQMLAQCRNKALSANDSPLEEGPTTLQKALETGSEPAENNSKKLSLAEIAAERRKGESRSNALSKLRLRSQESASSDKLACGSQNADVTVRKASDTLKRWQPEISFDVPSADLGTPSLLGAVIAEHQQPSWNSHTNFLATAKHAANAFSQPSADDVVKNAQSDAFSQPKKAPKMAPKVNAAPKAAQTVKLPKEENKEMPKASLKPLQAKTDLVSRLFALNLKPSCSFVVIGHVDAGKSTLMGRLLLDCGALSAKTVQKFEHESAKMGKPSFWLAWALDATSEERQRGVTVDIGEASFQTKTTNFTVLDAPGHKDYVPNMIAGVAQADIAVLVVDSDTNAFESGFSLDGQTKEHAILARSLGVDHIIVAVNKMDTQGWNELRFIEISTQLTEFLTKKVGFQASNILFVPTSGLNGVNVVSKVAQGSDPRWYEGSSLVEALDQFAHSLQDNSAKAAQPLRFAVSNTFTEAFQSTVTVSGRVLTGCVEAGDTVEIVNSHEVLKVKNISDKQFLVAGDQGELKLMSEADAAATDNIRPGDIIGGYGALLTVTKKFIAKIRLFDLPRPVLPGTPLAFHMGRVEDTVKVVSIISSLDPKQAGKKLRHLGKGAAARVILQLTKPSVLTPPEICKDLGRFVLRLNGATVGGGVVEDINPE